MGDAVAICWSQEEEIVALGLLLLDSKVFFKAAVAGFKLVLWLLLLLDVEFRISAFD